MNLGFAAAASIAAVTLGVHVHIGGVHVARSLLAARDLTRDSRWMNYYCWHITTMVIVAMAVTFAIASLGSGARSAAALLTLLAASFSILCLAVALKAKAPPFRFPAMTLFALIAVAGARGLVS